MPGSSKRPGGLRNISTSDPRANWGRRVSNLVDTTTVLDRWGSVCIKAMHLSVANIVCINRHINSKQASAFEHVVCHFSSVQQAMSWLICMIHIPPKTCKASCSKGTLCNACFNGDAKGYQLCSSGCRPWRQACGHQQHICCCTACCLHVVLAWTAEAGSTPAYSEYRHLV